MRRIMIMITTGALLLMAGCQQSGTTSQASSATSEVSSMTSSIIVSSDTSQTSSAAESVASKEQSPTSSAKPTASKAVTTKTAVAPESSAPAASTLASSSAPAPKTISINVPTTNSAGTLTFTSAKIDYEYKTVNLSFEFKAENPSFKLNPTPDSDVSAIETNSGKKLKHSLFGIKGKNTKTEYTGEGNIEYSGFSDPADISSITVTYKFKEITDPVTVKIALPGV